MNPVKKVLGHIFFFYAALMFAVTVSITAIFIIIANAIWKEPERSWKTYAIFKVWMNVYMPLILSPVFSKGKKKFKKGENYVVVVNHGSFVDILVSSLWVPGPNKTLAKDDFQNVPIFSVIYRSGSILVNRKSEESRKASFTKMQQALKNGLHLTLYPEGTRNKTDQPLQEFYDGAFITAIRAQKEIIPGILFNTKKVLPPKPNFWAWPHTIRFEFLDPISTKDYTLRQAGQLKDKVYKLMEDYIIANR